MVISMILRDEYQKQMCAQIQVENLPVQTVSQQSPQTIVLQVCLAGHRSYDR